MSSETLPAELIELVADNLVSIGHPSAFSCTSRRLYQVLDHRLYARDAKQGRKALYWSIKKGSYSVAKKTIHHGADRHVEIVKFLLEYGADPNPPDSRELLRTPLSAAAHSGCYEIAKILIEAGADVRATTIDAQWGPVALYTAASLDRNGDIMRLLLDKGVLDDAPEHYGIFALETAIDSGALSTAKLLVQAGVNPACRNIEDIALFFLEIGAGLDLIDNEGRGLMWYAAKYGFENIVRYLLERSYTADEQQDEQGRTPLRIAFDYRDQDGMELLVERGASLEGAGLDESQYHRFSSRPQLDH
ncbi:ankyrin repeat-containing domain protein [Fusarium solani]|uniref:Ankyrin repeat-containing domain protein n=1 Tax=Fusarium solani TaxID=169388 RepID=A0A9P9KTZ2_FUSSL|nr:ankyrin repeat-containing domain protein [Fusarium solani]KAH7268620.1 ankyrin repeat-containing domain protein [Fusarium solani]